MFNSLKTYLAKRSHANRARAIRRSFETSTPMVRFVAKDVRREIMVVNIDELADGFILVRSRTDNLLYLSKSLTEKGDFSDPERVSIDQLWKWGGASWGGLPDGTSMADPPRPPADQ